MEQGWIKLHRKLLENPLIKKPVYFTLWIYLLLKANHKDNEFMWNGEIIIIKDGQILTGRKELSKEINIPESTIEDILKTLEKQHQIQQQKTTKFRIITIINWNTYQKYNNNSNNKATTKRQQSDTNNNVKNENNEKKYLPPQAVEDNKNITKQIVNYFFELKGWDNKDKDFYSKNKIIYSRFTRPAKNLAELCDNNLEEAKECLKKVGEWAKSRDLDWSIETIFKKWYELDFLKPKEKKPYYDNCRIFQKSKEGKWFIIRNGEIKELGIYPRREEIIWK